jgi:hypothetical protein
VKRIACVCACVLLVGFAPAPVVRTETDPDKAIQQFEKDVKEKKSPFGKRLKKLIDHLKKLQGGLEKQGKTAQADAIRERLLLLDTISEEHLLGKSSAAEWLTKGANGRYKRLSRVLLLPIDEASYTTFKDFGFWNGTSYGGVTNLTPGYWVYVAPRWFIWQDGPPRP